MYSVSKNHGVKLRAQRDHFLPSDGPTLSPWTPTGMILETGPYQRESLISLAIRALIFGKSMQRFLGG